MDLNELITLFQKFNIPTEGLGESVSTPDNEVSADALQRYLEMDSSLLADAFAWDDVMWGLHGDDDAEPENFT